jgi:hypothetical protein
MRVQCFVKLEDGGWTVRLDGVFKGAFDSHADALRAAIDFAQKAGNDAQVLMQSRDGQFRAVWTNGTRPPEL